MIFSGIVKRMTWAVLASILILSCQQGHDTGATTHPTAKANPLPATNPSRARVVALEDKGGWYQHLVLFRTATGTRTISFMEPMILQIRNNRLSIADGYRDESAVYVNGQEAPVESLSQLSPEHVSEIFVMHQWKTDSTVKTLPNPYRVLIQTSATPVPADSKRQQFFDLLRAAKS